MPPPNDDTVWGAIHSAKISGNFGPKLNGLVRSNWKSYEKKGPYLFKRWTTNLVYRLLLFFFVWILRRGRFNEFHSSEKDAGGSYSLQLE